MAAADTATVVTRLVRCRSRSEASIQLLQLLPPPTAAAERSSTGQLRAQPQRHALPLCTQLCCRVSHTRRLDRKDSRQPRLLAVEWWRPPKELLDQDPCCCRHWRYCWLLALLQRPPQTPCGCRSVVRVINSDLHGGSCMWDHSDWCPCSKCPSPESNHASPSSYVLQ